MERVLEKVSVIGHFGHGKQLLNGQTIKTKMLTEELERVFGKDQVTRYDTSGKWKALFNIPFRLFKAFRHSDNIIILPAYKGIRYLMFLIALMRPFFTRTGLQYAVVGGWLPTFIDNKKLLAKWLHLLDGIYVETTTMKKALEAKGYKNVFMLTNFKEITPVTLSANIEVPEKPFKLCTFSRVMKGKGIIEAAKVIEEINKKEGFTAYTLDVFGPIWPTDREWFEQEMSTLSECIRYKGAVSFNESVSVLKDYFFLLFPTRFRTEGVPGTIIDAYAAGIPVLSSRWNSFADVIDENVTGIGYDFDNFEELSDTLKEILYNPERIVGMKEACVEKAKEYTAEAATSTLISNLV